MATYNDWQQRQMDIASGAEMDRRAERRMTGETPALRYMKTPEVAVLADCSTRHVERQVRLGLLRVTRVGRVNLFFENDVKEWLRNCRS